MDVPLLILLGMAALGVVSKNDTVTLAMLVLASLRLFHAERAFAALEKYGVTAGVVILTVGVMAPIASGRIGIPELIGTFTQWKSLVAVAVGIFVAYLGGRGAGLMAAQPLLVTGLLLGTVLGVAFFRGIPVGPLIAAGILALLVGPK